MKTKPIIIILLTLGLFFLTATSVLAQDIDDPLSISGRVQGTGISFEITDSEYLNISLQSSEETTIVLESVPKTISLNIEASSVSASTVLTFSNLEPNTTYYKFDNSYKNKTVLTTDSNGGHTFTQDLTQNHHIWFQSGDNGTVYLPADCTDYGTWDEPTSTCTLTLDIFESVEITTNNIILDCDSHSITGVDAGYGIYLNNKSGIEIRNCSANNFSYVIYLNYSFNNILASNIVASSGYGISLQHSPDNILNDNIVNISGQGIMLDASLNNILTNNTTSDNGTGIYLYGSSNNFLDSNIVTNNYRLYYGGIVLEHSSSNTLTSNMVNGNTRAIFLYSSSDNVFNFNMISGNEEAMFLSTRSNNNKIYHNNFIDNQEQVYVHRSTGNLFDNNYPDGGNYWSNYDAPEEGCVDINNDGFCDVPYNFYGGQDRYPFMEENGWEVPVNQPPAFSSPNQYKSDGITIISEGQTTTESIVVFKATVSDPDNDKVKLQVQIKEVDHEWQDIIESNLVNSGSEVIVTKYGLIEDQYRWRVRAIDERGVVSEWQEFGVPENVDFEVKLVPLYTQVESDYPSRNETERWVNQPYAHASEENPYRCGWTIGGCGCSITSMIMLGRYYDIYEAINGSNVDPGNINVWLVDPNNEGYQLDGDLWWGKAIEYLGFINETTDQIMVRINLDFYNASASVPWQMEEIDNHVNSARPVVAYSKTFGHYFIVDGKLTSTYTLKDPKWYGTTKLNQAPNPKGDPPIQGYNNHFDTANLFSYLEIPRPLTASIYIYLASPAELLVIDPLGRKLGKDPVVDITYNEIPDASYTKEGPIVSNDTPLEPSDISKSKVIYISSPIVGEYDVKVIGTDLGTYTLDSLAYNEAGKSVVKTFSGIVTDVGVISDYTIVYSSVPEEPVIIERVVVSEDVITEIESGRQLNLIDNDGVKNSLLQKLNNAQKQVKLNKNKSAINIFNAFINEVEAQKGKHINSEFAELLIRDVQYLIEDLRSSISNKDNKYAVFITVSIAIIALGASIVFVRRNHFFKIKKFKVPRVFIKGIGRTNFIILICSLLALILIMSGFIYIYYFKNKAKESGQGPCLKNSEIADWSFEKWWAERIKDPKAVPTIYVKDKNTNQVKFSLRIEDVMDHGHPLELHRCGIYALKEFNWDRKKSKPLSGFSVELWKYQYNGESKKILVLASKDESEEPTVDYSYTFRIDPLEKYIVLQQGCLGCLGEEYALIVKDLETREDIFVLPIKEITDKYPSLIGNLDLIKWSKGARYFWARTHYGAYTLGFFRIDTTNWSVDIFEVPEDVFGGAALNIEKGYVTKYPGYVWTGVHELTEQIKREWREQGKISSLYLYNLFTKDDILLATTSEPLWDFKDRWISDTELEYELPSGEKRIYNIENK